jgi:hypothetical protein
MPGWSAALPVIAKRHGSKGDSAARLFASLTRRVYSSGPALNGHHSPFCSEAVQPRSEQGRARSLNLRR